ncbi:MAG: GTP 3',8-cyclase MoaA [Treponemataceae bacterium]
MKDKFLRDITYLRVSLTDCCNFRCRYCMQENATPLANPINILSFDDLETIINELTNLGVSKIRLTGGEPLMRVGVESFIENLAKNPKIKDIAMTTNASLLSNHASQLKKSGLTRLNISLDTLNKKKFEYITYRDNFDATMNGIKTVLDLDFDIKINCVLMKGINDNEILDFIEFGRLNACKIRFIELMPIGSNNDFVAKHFISAQEIISGHNLIPCKGDDIHSPASCFFHPSSNQKIGFITPLSNHFCNNCNRIRLTAEGKIRPCLLQDIEYDLQSLLQRDQQLQPLLQKIIFEKPEKHKISEAIMAKKCMNSIGG